MEYIGEDYLICLDDIEKINVRQENIINDNNQLIETLLEKDRIVPDSIKILQNMMWKMWKIS